ncbi:ribosome maturation factor RimM [Hydrogenovibrio thermophilus]|uniref:Ribosome maturation factor RimM n=1 Tax=Hydrogenovibrio thermophilus TaxID=265883 RepID=A0A410H1S7_9GAMM|nr:ribosome maturation factor RimM [Hydrogenovibrio thermophilus]QAB14880.1 ribosome maturation factor RimM [Hydrogenovibrio thermophilus]
MSSSQDEHIILGQINGIYGVQGWVKIFSHTEPRENILNYSPWLVRVKGEWRTMSLQDGRSQAGGKSIIAKLDGVDDRDVAREFMGCDIAITPDQLPDTDDGYYWRHLIGCEVSNLQGEVLGQVSEIVETGAHDVLRVTQILPGGETRTTLIPFVMDTFILAVDVDAKRIQVDWQADDEDSDT